MPEFVVLHLSHTHLTDFVFLGVMVDALS